MKKYAIGIDFGTLSCRALLVSLVGEDAGAELACAVCDYPHGVIDGMLPASGEILPADFALQDPDDYLYALSQVVPEVIAKAGVDKADVVSVGVDFTCSTLIPVYENGLPLCFDPKFAKEKHAYVKLWKHHAAQPYADRITELATQRGEPWIARMGGKVSSEFTLPKLWELLDRAPEVYEACDSVIEGGDFIVSHLVGTQVRSYVTAAYYCYVLSFLNRSIILRQIALHQIDTCQIFVGRIHALQALSRNIHKARQTGTRTDKHRLIAHIKKFIYSENFADNHIGFYFYAECFQVFHFFQHLKLFAHFHTSNLPLIRRGKSKSRCFARFKLLLCNIRFCSSIGKILSPNADKIFCSGTRILYRRIKVKPTNCCDAPFVCVANISCIE